MTSALQWNRCDTRSNRWSTIKTDAYYGEGVCDWRHTERWKEALETDLVGWKTWRRWVLLRGMSLLAALTLDGASSTMGFAQESADAVVRALGRENRDGGERIEGCRRLQSQGGVVKVKSKALAINARRPNAALGRVFCQYIHTHKY
jgi:hypothetical protein